MKLARNGLKPFMNIHGNTLKIKNIPNGMVILIVKAIRYSILREENGKDAFMFPVECMKYGKSLSNTLF
jgi:hypothetical protein